jgi:hypothetical protein
MSCRPLVVGIASGLLEVVKANGTGTGFYFSTEVAKAHEARLVFFRAN